MKRTMIVWMLSIFFCLRGTFAQAPETELPYLLLENVRLVDLQAAVIREGHSVLIHGQEILAVGRTEDLEIPQDSRRFQANGLYLLPGLIDSHVHTIDPSTFGPLMVANGVVFARDMGGPTEAILQLKHQWDQPEAIAPELMVSGALVDGSPPVWPFSEECKTPAEGRAAVKKLAGAGVDFIKVYSRLSAEVYHAVLDEADLQGIPVVGHVPAAVSLEEAAETGQVTNEHLQGFGAVFAKWTGVESGSGLMGAENAGWKAFPQVERSRLKGMLQNLAKAKMAQCPTLAVYHRIAHLNDPELLQDPNLKYVPPWLLEMWNPNQDFRFKGRTDEDYQESRRAFSHRLKVVKMLQESGVPLLAGTDLANPYLVAGFALHEELALLQEAGLSPVEALRAATTVPAAVLEQAKSFGAVQPGKRASLVLVKENPLEGAEALLRPELVVLKGKLLERKDLDALLKQAEENAQEKKTPMNDLEQPGEASLPGHLVERGTLNFLFGTRPAGEETFQVTQSPDGLHYQATSRPSGGFQPATKTIVHLTAENRFESAHWEQLSEGGFQADYHVEDGTLVATGSKAGESLGQERIELPENWILLPPATSIYGAQLHLVKLQPGETQSFQAVSFGFPSWKPTVASYELERLEDAEYQGKLCHHYSFISTNSMGQLKGEMWVEPRGILLRTVLKMGFGQFEAVLSQED